MRIINLILFVLCSLGAFASDIVDVYKLTMAIKVPVIVDNMTSQGKRVYKVQKLYGLLTIRYSDNEKPIINVVSLENRSYKIRGEYVTYKCNVDDEYWISRLNYIGNNKTGVFTTPTIVFYVDCNPSYNAGEDEPDNTLLMVMSGRGYSSYYNKYNARIPTRFIGVGAGQIGCGCHAYGHVSPTRGAGPCGPTSEVQDIAAIICNFNLKFQYRTLCK